MGLTFINCASGFTELVLVTMSENPIVNLMRMFFLPIGLFTIRRLGIQQLTK
jgi:hypothetical protein